MRNIKSVRKDLHMWGLFWQDQQKLGGWARRSPVDKCCEILITGIQVSSNAFLNNDKSDSINVPTWIAELDEIYINLPAELRLSLKYRYKMTGIGKQTALSFGMDPGDYERSLRYAENEVMKRLP